MTGYRDSQDGSERCRRLSPPAPWRLALCAIKWRDRVSSAGGFRLRPLALLSFTAPTAAGAIHPRG